MANGESVTTWLGQYPEILAVLIVGLGWLLAILMRRAAIAAIPWLNRHLARWGSRGGALITPVFAAAFQFFCSGESLFPPW